MEETKNDVPWEYLEQIVFNGKPSELLYFAYGSNMNAKQISERCDNPRKIGTARLPNYELAFFGHSATWDGGFETVVPSPGHDVWGVVYQLTALDSDRLDVWQDARMDGNGSYFHYPAHVVDRDGVRRTVLFYKKDMQGEPQCPSREYLDFIVCGAEQNDLPPAYVADLRRITASPAGFPVPKRRKFGRELLVDVYCSQCGGDCQ